MERRVRVPVGVTIEARDSELWVLDLAVLGLIELLPQWVPADRASNGSHTMA